MPAISVRIRNTCRKTAESFKCSSPVVLALFWTAIIVLPILIIERGISTVNQASLKMLQGYMEKIYINDRGILYQIFAAIIWYPLVEELMFRGPVRLFQIIFYQTRRHLFWKNAALFGIIFLQAYIWAFQHSAFMTSYLALGLILGILVVKTKKLWMAFLFHIIINMLAIIGFYTSYLFTN